MRGSARLVVLAAVGMMAFTAMAPPSAAAGGPLAETPEQRDARMKWWREARFGLFVHWRLDAVLAGEYKGKRLGGIGEWIMDRAKIPVPEYEKLVPRFNPVKFDAGEWAQLAIIKLGTMKLARPGKHTLTVKATRKPRLAVMNLKAIVLRPAK